jgi:hypothetical protein
MTASSFPGHAAVGKAGLPPLSNTDPKEVHMRTLPIEHESNGRVIPIAMIAFALAAVLVGGGDPQGRAPTPQTLTQDQLEQVRADRNFGFPTPPQPAPPPHGIGA